MGEILTIQLRDTALADFVRRRAEAEQRTPDAVIEDAIRQLAGSGQEAEALDLRVAPELRDQPHGTLVRDAEEDDESFACRQRSFAMLMRLT